MPSGPTSRTRPPAPTASPGSRTGCPAPASFGYTLLGYLRYRRGRLTEAEDLVRDGLRLAERVGRGTPVLWYAVAVYVEVLLARGRPAEARELAGEYAFGEPFPNAVVFPDTQTVHGELLFALGRHREAAAGLAAAGRRLEPRAMRNPAWSPWQLHLALAEAPAAPERARAELAAAGLRPRRLRTTDTDALSARERAVAERAARGLPAARIAAETGVDERAVALLLSAVYRKVGTDAEGLAAALRGEA